MNRKIASYIGFSIESGAIVLGLENLEKCKKNIPLVITRENLSEPLKKELMRLKDKKEFYIIALGEELDIAPRLKGVKILGVLNEHLAQAILNETNK